MRDHIDGMQENLYITVSFREQGCSHRIEACVAVQDEDREKAVEILKDWWFEVKSEGCQNDDFLLISF